MAMTKADYDDLKVRLEVLMGEYASAGDRLTATEKLHGILARINPAPLGPVTFDAHGNRIPPVPVAVDAAGNRMPPGPVAVDAAGNPIPVSFDFAGRVGEAFSISGQGFGDGGVVTIGGRTISPTRWNPTSISGIVPADLPSGPIEVTVNGHAITSTI